MGFFNFIRHDVQKEGEQQNANTHPLPSPQISVIEKNKAEQPLPDKKKRQKDDIDDFFHVNIRNIFKHEPEFVEKYNDGNGKVVEKYMLGLQKPELSSFNQINILRYENGNYDLFFTGQTEVISEDMIDFVNYCADVLGDDFMRKKSFSEKDIRDMNLGVFSRIWHDRVRIENIYYTLTLTLYNICPQI
jgi:hypothetical protein